MGRTCNCILIFFKYAIHLKLTTQLLTYELQIFYHAKYLCNIRLLWRD